MSQQKWILVVDDDPSVRELLARVLSAEGYGVLSAGSGHEARNVASCLRIDLVLLDLNLPDQSGWDTFEALTTGNPTLPIVIITARANQLFTARGAGVGALMEKPLDFPVLLKTIRELLAEPIGTRLARAAGHSTGFNYSHPL